VVSAQALALRPTVSVTQNVAPASRQALRELCMIEALPVGCPSPVHHRHEKIVRRAEQVMYRLYDLTGDQEFAVAAERFDKPAFWAPLLAGADPLPGLHANTHLAQARVRAWE